MEDATIRARELAYELVDWNAVLAALRAEGFSKTGGIRATVDVRRLPLQEAKRLVHESEAWRAVRELDEAVLDEIVEQAIGLGAKIDPPQEG